MKRTKVLACLVGLTACSVSEERFATKYATAECDLFEDCELLDAFGGSWYSCEESVYALWLAKVTEEDCDYSGKKAFACLKEKRDETCDDLYGEQDAVEEVSACDEVCGEVEEG